MSDVEIFSGGGLRRRWRAGEKRRFVKETMFEGEIISAVGQRNDVAPNLLDCWHKRVLEGDTGGDSATRNKAVRKMENRIGEWERQLGRKTFGVEILKQALDKSRSNLRHRAREAASRPP